ncbi:MAG: nif-specific transcriptional activator NifA [Alphaproteobacteria bacterium]|nr:nif-specific transcriptional activator NifA [Alphaproteobacteria bacterium]
MGAYGCGKETLSLASIYEISKLLTSSQTLETALRDVINVLSSYLEMRRAMVVLKGADGKMTVLAAAGATLEALRRGEVRPPAKVANGIFSTGMPVVISTVADDPEFDEMPDVLDDEVVAEIGVPIKNATVTVGFLAIDRIWSSDRQVRIDNDVRFLTMVANLIGQTVRLYASNVQDGPAAMPTVVAAGPEKTPRRSASFESIIGNSRRMQEVFAQIEQVAPTRSPVLLRGESGTGKELCASAVHALSPRHDKPFVKLNCAALPETLLESELFGHEKGAFTGATAERKGRFELASGGTLFLDEIGETSPAFQAKLLRVLQEGEFERLGGNKTIKVDVRLITATNRDLEKAVAEGDFRADLYYRINVVPVFLPPLRERKDDIIPLAKWFLGGFNKENGRSLAFSHEALEILRGCAFPGNVRELENCVYRVATMCRGSVIQDVDLACQRRLCPSSSLWTPKKEIVDSPRLPPRTDGGAMITDAEAMDGLPRRDRLIGAMEKAGWVQAKAARLLDMTPRQIGYALRKYNIDVKRF